MRQRGFTLVEFIIAAAIVAIVAAAAVRSYQQAVVRAQLAQQLVNVGHIRKVVMTESQGGRRDLLAGTRAGAAPAGLRGLVPDQEFQDSGGLRLQLVHLPAGTVNAMPRDGSFGLIADTTADPERLWLFQREIDKAGFSTVWLSQTAFAFPIADYVAAATAPSPAPVPTPPPAQAAVQPPVPALPASVAPVAPTLPPVAAAGCPSGWRPVGNSDNCKPPSQGTPCPPGWVTAGKSGNCRPDRSTGTH